MKVRHLWRFLLLIAVLTVADQSVAAVIYSEDFSVDPTANWTVNAGPGERLANFYYDYSAIGVPLLPMGLAPRPKIRGK